MAFDRIIQAIRQIKHDLEVNREADATRIVLDQSALTKLRIQTKGESASGAAFAPYVPPYAKERKKSGYQVGYVDFTRTGRMWAAVRPYTISKTPFSATIGLRGSDKRSQDIIEGAYPKRGDILEPSKAEIELSRQANVDRILKPIRKYFQI